MKLAVPKQSAAPIAREIDRQKFDCIDYSLLSLSSCGMALKSFTKGS
jgi:hypothetical protein